MKNDLEHFQNELCVIQSMQDGDECSPLLALESDRLQFSQCNGLYDISWYAGPYGFQSHSYTEISNPMPSQFIDDGLVDDYEYGLDWLIDILIKHADKIRSLRLLNPYNFGYNGSADWDLIRLVESEAIFAQLQLFELQLYEPGDHNISYVSHDDTAANHHLTQILARMPSLYQVILPTPPDENFFNLNFKNLNYMKIQAGFDSKHFIRNMASSQLLSQITLDYMDCLYVDEQIDVNPSLDSAYQATDFSDYQALISSKYRSEGSSFSVVLRESRLTPSQLQQLYTLNPKMQLLHVPVSEGYYLSHRFNK